MKVSTISAAAQELGFALGDNRVGRPSLKRQKLVNKRNLLMLAVYEDGYDGRGRNNYGGSMTRADLEALFELGPDPTGKALRKARRMREDNPNQFNQIKEMLYEKHEEKQRATGKTSLRGREYVARESQDNARPGEDWQAIRYEGDNSIKNRQPVIA